MLNLPENLSDEEVVELEKKIVELYYDKRTDLYQLCSIHNPEAYARSQKKQKIPEKTRWKVWRRDRFVCQYCGLEGNLLTLDHVIPEEQGGNFGEDNLVTACAKCNNKKGSMSVEEFWNSEWLKKKRNHQRLSTTIHPILAKAINGTPTT